MVGLGSNRAGESSVANSGRERPVGSPPLATNITHKCIAMAYYTLYIVYNRQYTRNTQHTNNT